jgi:hypothetical protein
MSLIKRDDHSVLTEENRRPKSVQVLTRKNNYYQGEKLGELHLEKEEGNEMQM